MLSSFQHGLFLLSFDILQDNGIGSLENFNDKFSSLNYNAFQLNKALQGNLLAFTMQYTYHKFDWKNTLPRLNSKKFQTLSLALQNSYRDVSYHSQVHAADVVQSICYIIEQCDCKFILNLSPYLIFTMVLSGAAHDVNHPGTNNFFEVKR